MVLTHFERRTAAREAAAYAHKHIDTLGPGIAGHQAKEHSKNCGTPEHNLIHSHRDFFEIVVCGQYAVKNGSDT
jgi:hypothetical protein